MRRRRRKEQVVLKNISACHYLSTAVLCTASAPKPTFTNNQLVFGSCRVRQEIIRLNYGRRLSIGNSKIIRCLRRISWGWWKNTGRTLISADPSARTGDFARRAGNWESKRLTTYWLGESAKCRLHPIIAHGDDKQETKRNRRDSEQTMTE